MNKYRVMFDYVSGFGGPWVEGELVEMTVEEARTINVDCPGVLEIYEEPKPVIKKARKQPAKKNRMVKEAEDRNG